MELKQYYHPQNSQLTADSGLKVQQVPTGSLVLTPRRYHRTFMRLKFTKMIKSPSPR